MYARVSTERKERDSVRVRERERERVRMYYNVLNGSASRGQHCTDFKIKDSSLKTYRHLQWTRHCEVNMGVPCEGYHNQVITF